MKPPLLILGATGGIGRGIVAAAVVAGHPVIAVARDKTRLRQLQARHRDAQISLLPALLASDDDGARLAKAVQDRGQPLGGVIAALSGGGGRGCLLDQPATALRDALDADLLPHLVAARHLLPLLASSHRGGYVLVGGPGGDQPWAGYGCRSIATAALRMLARVLHDEARTHEVRVQLLLVDTPVRTDANHGQACPQWPTSLEVGQRALALLEPSQRAGPACAVVRFAAQTTPLSVHNDDLSMASISSTAQTSAQVPDSARDDNTQRCLQDARTLLDSLASTHYPEAFPR